MSIGREGAGPVSPDSDAKAKEPVAAAAEVVAAPEGVNAPQRERVMPSIESLNARNAAERSAAEKREKGETPMGALELIAREADARAQETLAAQNKGLVNRVTNIAKGAWKAFSGFMSFIKKDIVLPVYDAISTNPLRKQNGVATTAAAEKIAGIQQAIRNTSGEARKALEEKLSEAEDELAMLEDPRNAARNIAERNAAAAEAEAASEKAAAAAEQAEAKAYMKSEEERMAAEKLAVAVAEAKEAHAAKLERERIAREGRANLGRGAVILLSSFVGADPAKSELTENQIVAIGSVIEGAKKGLIGAINLPGRVAAIPERVTTGLTEYKNGEIAKAKAAYELTAAALDDMTLGEDRRELWAFTKGALSFTGAVLRNADVQQEVLDILGQEQVFAADELGSGAEVVSNRGTADVLINAIKDGTVNSAKEMGKAIADAARDIRDSEAVATAKKVTKDATKVAAAGAGGYAAGTASMAAAPFVFMGAAAVAPYMLGAAATGAAAYGTYRAGKAGIEAAGRGYDAAADAAARKFIELAPAISDAIGPAIEATAQFATNVVNVRRDGQREIAKLGADMSDTLISTAESLNDKTRRGIAFYRDMKARLGTLSEASQLALNELEKTMLALAKTARDNNPELAADVTAAVEARATVDAEAAAQVNAEAETPADPMEAPTPRFARAQQVGGVVPVQRKYNKMSA